MYFKKNFFSVLLYIMNQQQQSLAPLVRRQKQQHTLTPIVQQQQQSTVQRQQTQRQSKQPLSTVQRQQTLAPIVQQTQRQSKQPLSTVQRQQTQRQSKQPLSTVQQQQTLAPIVQQTQKVKQVRRQQQQTLSPIVQQQNVDFDLLDQEYIQNKQLYEQAKRRFEQDILKSNNLQQFSSILQPQTMFPNVNPQNVQSYSMSSRSVYNNGDFYSDVESRQNVRGKITQKSRLIQKKKGQKPKIIETPTNTYYQTQPKYIE